MRNVLLCAILFAALAGSTNGEVTIIAQDVGGGKLLIGYQTSVGPAPVAFGLNIVLTNGATFSSVTPATENFSYYPGRFRDYINPSDPQWDSPDYYPAAAIGDLAALGGLNTSGMTIEMATMPDSFTADPLYTDLNSDGITDLQDLSIFSNSWLNQDTFPDPADLNLDGCVDFFDYSDFLSECSYIPSMAGNLLLLQINGNGAQTTFASIYLDTVRGGVVLENSCAASTTLPLQVSVIVPEPATILLLGLGAAMVRKQR